MVTYVADEHGALTYISPQVEEWTGLPAGRWTSDPTFWHEMIHPDDRERVLSADFGNGSLDVEYRMYSRDGEWRWIWEKEVRVPGQTGSQGVCVDITALREARAELDAARERPSRRSPYARAARSRASTSTTGSRPAGWRSTAPGAAWRTAR
jgi:PAS domain S-box-containing protein